MRKLDRFILCCYAEKSVEGITCDSPTDEFSSCDDLMKNKTLQICIWILGILAFLGNLLVIIWRIIDKEENRFKRLTYKSAVFTCAAVWILGVVISVIPITGIDYFYDKSVAYILMFWTVKRSARAVRSTSMKKESAMAKRLIFIVMTDFCCWIPIIIISILSLTGNFYDPDKIAFVWIAVFVLPLNSSLNPILYTFSTERTKQSLARKRKNITGMVMKSLNSRAGDQSMDCLRTNAENTLVSIAESSPRPIKKIVEKQEQQRKLVKTRLKLIEVVDIFQEDTIGKRSTGYVTAWCEEEGVLGMYFGKEMKEDWTREIDIVEGLSSSEDPQDNLLHYRWHSKASEQSIEHGKKKIHGIQGSSWLICYDFESSSTLEDFLSEKGIFINFDAVCAVVCDVITAIEHLLNHGISHNNITTGNILIRHCPRVPPIKAVLGGFSQASKADDAGAFTNSAADEQSCYSHDIKQFGHLLATLLGHCHGSSEYVKLHEIMNLCFEDTEEKRPTARYIREVLEETWCTEGVWDTYL
ncbi:hypothetical protein pdam_00007570 [Pocillopora damicornis]|uniref:G-protein coupled receptors family 1 profile domain-containing protein n=1 Tax=Pocillopora damicornis TaxID=46731 RepID=A0A3M6V601_POCDA|nr:hypothetical protein pdam_00007570 [Pocillopora damicornis]